MDDAPGNALTQLDAFDRRCCVGAVLLFRGITQSTYLACPAAGIALLYGLARPSDVSSRLCDEMLTPWRCVLSRKGFLSFLALFAMQ